jgi:hypothetical protein
LNQRIHNFPQCVKSCIIFVPKNNAKYRKLKLFCVNFSALVPNFNLHYILSVLEKEKAGKSRLQLEQSERTQVR